ncbi:MAG: YcxB family protein, partial [Myxococcota bacterium]
ARWWRSSRVLRLGQTYASHVSRAGVLSGSEGLRTFTPWGSVTGWWPRDGFVFLSTTGGVWHMIPKHAVPDEAESWFEAARAARREARPRPVPRMEPGRDNPFQPPSV